MLTLVDKTLDREVEIFEMAFVTDIFDQKDAVESLDEALKLEFVILAYLVSSYYVLSYIR